MTSVVPASSAKITRSSTEPFEVVGLPGNALKHAGPPRGSTNEWSFGPRDANPILPASAITGLAPPAPSATASNVDPSNTDAPQRVEVPDVEPAERPRWNPHNKRSMRALTRWEGVVESFTGDGFVARLYRLENGVPDYSKIEQSQFTWDELNIPRDADFVDEGSVFYWALVRRTNEAGTHFQTTGLRFKRVPAITREQERAAAREAAEILEKFRQPPSI
jgi:hypothetical protein